MNSDNPKIQTLLTLGDPGSKRNWPSYVEQYGFTLDDVPTLLMLYADEEINSMNSDRPEVWTQVHVWRTLGQLGSEAAIETIVPSFDTLHDDDYAETERLYGTITSLEIKRKRISEIPTWPWRSETARFALTAIALPLILTILQLLVIRAFGS